MSKMTFEQVRDHMNGLKLIQKSGEWLDDLSEKDRKIFMDHFSFVTARIGTTRYRWYETATEVYRMGEMFIGVVVITMLYSESMSVDDCYHSLIFKDMKREEAVTYVYK